MPIMRCKLGKAEKMENDSPLMVAVLRAMRAGLTPDEIVTLGRSGRVA